MSLTAYKKKRDFKQTSEPAGRKNNEKKALLFVVQEHAASHLHYDFRLEMDGVLKSWAVPKGPSMNPDVKHLAMMVEDHPYDYKDFEGNIPKGNYGAGNVIVWDNGAYHSLHADDKENSEKELLAGLEKGHISFILEGKKLKGEFALIKLKAKQDNAWLLIKKNDEYATKKDILKNDKSVLSGATLASLEKTQAVVDEKTILKKTVKKKSLVKPMLAKITEKPFDSKDWIFETKYDGYRALALCDGQGNVKFYSRNLLSFNEKYPAIVEALKKIQHPCLLDGEIIVEDKTGNSHFQLLQNYLDTGRGNLKYYVFDLLELDNTDITQLPLAKRKELLKTLIDKANLRNVLYSEHVNGKGIKFFKNAAKKGWEGIMAKLSESLYYTNCRSSNWLKIKLIKQQEAIITGFTAPQGHRSYFGSILLGAYKNGKLKYIGHCGTGFDEKALKSLYQKFKPLFMSKPPFDEKIIPNNKVQWLKPKLVCEIKFAEWTAEENMRQPVFLGLREDKDWKDVKIEKPA